jgi:microcin C transport system substrate-binding protein
MQLIQALIWSRRQWFAAVLLVALTGCGAPQPPPEADTVDELQPLTPPVRPSALPAELPADLVWRTNDTDPTFASPAARRGGTFRTWMLSFPLTLRRVGPDSNGGFAAYTRYIQMPLVAFHPETGNPIPGLATHWAFDKDGKTVYYRLDRDAKWSDGYPVTAQDFVFTRDFMRSKEIVAPWYNNQYTAEIIDIRAYDDNVIGVEGVSAKPEEELIASYQPQVVPAHFYKMSKSWVRDYNWRVEPCTGAYRISEVRKGKYIELERIDDWWANDRRYQRYRYNPDRIRVKVIRELNVAFQHFLKGEIDTFSVVLPPLWHEKSKGPDFDNGYINRYWFYTRGVQDPGGMFMNMDEPLLANHDIRLGIAHSLNFEHVNATVLRGDYERLQTFDEGYGDYDNTEIRARKFDLELADEYFTRAGFGTRGPDGVRTRNDGQRLSFRVSYGTPPHTERLVVLKEQAKKAGLELVLELKDSSSAFKQVQEKKHQIGWMTWAGQGISPTFWEFWHSVNAHKTQTNNITNFDDAQMDEMIDRFMTSTSKAERVRLARAMEQRIHDVGPFVPGFKVPYTREIAWRWMKLPDELGTQKTELLFNPLEISQGLFSSGGLFWIDIQEKQRVRDARDDGVKFEPIFIRNEKYRR